MWSSKNCKSLRNLDIHQGPRVIWHLGGKLSSRISRWWIWKTTYTLTLYGKIVAKDFMKLWNSWNAEREQSPEDTGSQRTQKTWILHTTGRPQQRPWASVVDASAGCSNTGQDGPLFKCYQHRVLQWNEMQSRSSQEEYRVK